MQLVFAKISIFNGVNSRYTKYTLKPSPLAVSKFVNESCTSRFIILGFNFQNIQITEVDTQNFINRNYLQMSFKYFLTLKINEN